MTFKEIVEQSRKRRHEISSLPKSKHSQIAFYLLSPSHGIFCSLIPKAPRQWLSEERKRSFWYLSHQPPRRMLIKDWSRHSNTLVILLLENKTRNSASSFLLLGISQISSFDLHASCRLSSLRTGTWSVGRGSLRHCWETSSWHNEKKLTPKDSISLAFCELTSHSCLWGVKTSLGAAIFISDVSRAGL